MPVGHAPGGPRPSTLLWLLALAVAGWASLAWLAFAPATSAARFAMPQSPRWQFVNGLAVWAMWAVMMAAMMLPSALPMVATFGRLCARAGERGRAQAFVAGYLLVWLLFSAGATALQWSWQAAGWIDPMGSSQSAPLTAGLLLLAGAYQFSPLKRACLAGCRTPLGFLVGEWRPGVSGGLKMGWRHGLLCLGCCWALMALLFIGGVMNLAWIAALSIAVAIEKTAPGGERLAQGLGLALLAAGALRLVSLLQ
jgi:predicted metal-binding membrane protein